MDLKKKAPPRSSSTSQTTLPNPDEFAIEFLDSRPYDIDETDGPPAPDGYDSEDSCKDENGQYIYSPSAFKRYVERGNEVSRMKANGRRTKSNYSRFMLTIHACREYAKRATPK